MRWAWNVKVKTSNVAATAPPSSHKMLAAKTHFLGEQRPHKQSSNSKQETFSKSKNGKQIAALQFKG